MENLRPILWLSLAFILFLMWQAWNADYGTGPTVDRTSDAELDAPLERPEDVPEAPEFEAETLDATAVPEAQPEPAQQVVSVRTDLLDLQIDTRGGTITRADLLAFPIDPREPEIPVRLLDQRLRGYVAQSGLTHDRAAGLDGAARAPSHHAVFQTDTDRFDMGDADSLRVPMTWTSEDGSVRVTKTYVFQRGSHLVEVEHQIENLGETPWVGRQYRQLRHGPTPPRSEFFLYTFTGAAWYDGRYNKEQFESFEGAPLEQRLDGGWVSVIEHYFMSAWIPGEDEINVMYARAVPGVAGRTDYLIGLHSAESLTVAPGDSGVLSTRLWIGPKSQDELSEIARGLELTVDYGIFTFLAKPLFWLLQVIHDFVGNWGWAIVILTILIKLAFFHLSADQLPLDGEDARGGAETAGHEGTLQGRQAAHEHRADGAVQEGEDQPARRLPADSGADPGVHCAVLGVARERGTAPGPVDLWIQDLSTRDPFFILPVLMGLTMFIQYKLNPPPMDPIQQKIFMALPFVFTVFFAFFPAGLVLYWFTNNLFSIGQQYVITRKIEAGAAKKN
jgi:YidC/Oxa1 family membrane protein insertase